MTDLFAHAAEAAKREAMARAEDHASKGWKEVMLELVRLTCREQLLFSADDVFDRYDSLPNKPLETHDKRAFGPVMMKAAKLGYCEKTDRVRDSTRKSLHASPIAIWRSKLYAR